MLKNIFLFLIAIGFSHPARTKELNQSYRWLKKECPNSFSSHFFPVSQEILFELVNNMIEKEQKLSAFFHQNPFCLFISNSTRENAHALSRSHQLILGYDYLLQHETMEVLKVTLFHELSHLYYEHQKNLVPPGKESLFQSFQNEQKKYFRQLVIFTRTEEDLDHEVRQTIDRFMKKNISFLKKSERQKRSLFLKGIGDIEGYYLFVSGLIVLDITQDYFKEMFHQIVFDCYSHEALTVLKSQIAKLTLKKNLLLKKREEMRNQLTFQPHELLKMDYSEYVSWQEQQADESGTFFFLRHGGQVKDLFNRRYQLYSLDFNNNNPQQAQCMEEVDRYDDPADRISVPRGELNHPQTCWRLINMKRIALLNLNLPRSSRQGDHFPEIKEEILSFKSQYP